MIDEKVFEKACEIIRELKKQVMETVPTTSMEKIRLFHEGNAFNEALNILKQVEKKPQTKMKTYHTIFRKSGGRILCFECAVKAVVTGCDCKETEVIERTELAENQCDKCGRSLIEK